MILVVFNALGPQGPAAFQAVGLRARPKGPAALSGRGPQGAAAFQAVGLRARPKGLASGPHGLSGRGPKGPSSLLLRRV